MTEQEKIWFKKLQNKRQDQWRTTLSDPDMGGISRNLSDMYSTKAHFIYELLQNADDAQATRAYFELYRDKAVFRHNGGVHFSVSDCDAIGVKRGHLNAIVSIPEQSDKEKEDGPRIGKFGVGFKAVFRYTDCPEIYDDNMCFSIRNKIIPELKNDDYVDRQNGETVFVIPFKDDECQKSYDEVKDTLEKLEFPTLFLHSLKSVEYRIGNGNAVKYCIETKYKDTVKASGIEAKRLFLVKKCNNLKTEEKPLWFFSVEKDNFRCSVGYFINETGEIVPQTYPAFCFFKTNVATNFGFLIHAPFKVNHTREGICVGYEHNEKMISNLANLAVEGLKYLCSRYTEKGNRIVTDNVVNIIPIKEENHGDGISFDAFRVAFQKLFQNECVIPTSEGYVDKAHAYWPSSHQLSKLFSNEQLQELYGDKGIRWAFPTIPHENKSGNVASEIFAFIKSCTCKIDGAEAVTDINIIGKITPEFTEAQKLDWLGDLYTWIYENNERRQKARTAPIFINQRGKACAAFNEKLERQLYLPVDGEVDDRYNMVRSDLLEYARCLIDAYQLRKPEGRDWINIILSERLPNADSNQVDGLLRQVLKYYISCGDNDKSEIAGELKGIKCWRSTVEGVGELYSVEDLYIESDLLKAYFEYAGADVRYIDVQHYADLLGGDYITDVRRLFSEMEVAECPRIKTEQITDIQRIIDLKTNGPYSKYRLDEWRSPTNRYEIQESQICGLEQFLNKILQENDVSTVKAKSLILWKILGQIGKALSNQNQGNLKSRWLKNIYKSQYRYFRNNKWNFKEITSKQYDDLMNSTWLVSKTGERISPQKAALNTLAEEYRQVDDWFIVSSMLNIEEGVAVAGESEKELEARNALSEVAKGDLKLGEKVKELGLDLKDLEEMARIKSSNMVKDLVPSIATPDVPKENNVDEQIDIPKGMDPLERVKAKVRNAVEKTKNYKAQKRVTCKNDEASVQSVLPSVDSDPMQPKVVDFEKRAEELRKRVEAQIDQLRAESELQEAAVEAAEYSYAWLEARLDLEMRERVANDDNQREASVSFARMEREPDTENMFILSAPSESIPQWFEEEINQRLTIRILGGHDIETVIESMSVKSFQLRAKVRIVPRMVNLDYSKVIEAKTVATKPTFLLNELKAGYEGLNFSSDYNLKENLPEDIRFIFGPPGTGKTTYLARKVLLPLVQSVENPRILVLTPTNKAADVLTKRIIKECGEDDSYIQWLTRFGITIDPALQMSPVARGKDVIIDDDQPAVIVTTIDRFAYDAFASGTIEKIADFNWDYIVIDEASMIPLMKILYPIYKVKDAKYVIAGDPMQIAPVVKSDLSVGQNIYTMIGLEDFANPRTEPHNFEVVCLDTQYRSVPCIGRIFSEFAYSGRLNHNRAATDEIDLDVQIDGMPSIKPLTLLRYPVSRFESIFKIKLLGMSSYQIYSALFVFEYICKLAKGLKDANRKGFRIGVISPYRSQADIVGRLIAKVDRSLLECVDISVGTVHSFQGDECEMIIALLNPPQGMGRREGSFINDKRVLNVAISRARDYLVVAIPDENTPNVQYLRGPQAIAGLMRRDSGVFSEEMTPDLEEKVWGDRDYIEKNTYSTGHQNVNVYETPEKRFEVRSEESAVDVHFRADRSEVAPNDDRFVSGRALIQSEHEAQKQERDNFVIPTGFHKPVEGERVPAMKQYYVIGEPEPLECESETEDIDPSLILAIED